jgi:hypothetical protein
MSDPEYKGILIFVSGWSFSGSLDSGSSSPNDSSSSSSTASSGHQDTTGMQKLSEQEFVKSLGYKIVNKQWIIGDDLSSQADIVKTVKDFLNAHPGGEVVLVGHSFGADDTFEGTEALAKEDIFVNKLIMVDPVGWRVKMTPFGLHEATPTLPSNVGEGWNISSDIGDKFSWKISPVGRLNEVKGAHNIIIHNVEHTKIDDANGGAWRIIEKILTNQPIKDDPQHNMDVVNAKTLENTQPTESITERLPENSNPQPESRNPNPPGDDTSKNSSVNHKVLENPTEREPETVNSQPETHQAHPLYEEYVNNLEHKDWTKYSDSEYSGVLLRQDGKSQPDDRNVTPMADDNTNQNVAEHKPLENPMQKETDAQSSQPETHRAHPLYEDYVNNLLPKDWTKYDGSENSGVLLRQDGKSQPDGRSVTPIPDNNADKNFIEHRPLENPTQKETETLNSQPDSHKDFTKDDPTKNIAGPVLKEDVTSSDSSHFRDMIDDIRQYYRDDAPGGRPEFVEGTSPKVPTELEGNSINVGDAKSLNPDTQLKSIGQRPSESDPNLGTQGNLSTFSEEASLTNKHPGKESMSPGDIKGQVDMIYNEKPSELSSQKDGGMTRFANGDHLFGSEFEQQIDSLYESAAGDKNAEIEGYGFGGYSENVKQDMQGIAAEGYSANQDFSAEVIDLYEDFKSNDSTGQFSGGGDSSSSMQMPSAENIAVNGSKPDMPNLADTPEPPKKRGF